LHIGWHLKYANVDFWRVIYRLFYFFRRFYHYWSWQRKVQIRLKAVFINRQSSISAVDSARLEIIRLVQKWLNVCHIDYQRLDQQDCYVLFILMSFSFTGGIESIFKDTIDRSRWRRYYRGIVLSWMGADRYGRTKCASESAWISREAIENDA
jgi:hypothetical protein